MLTIRQARPSDCDSICAVHRAAITHHYAPAHGDDASGWAELLRPDSYKEPVEHGVMILAEEAGKALGFAAFNADTGQVDMTVLPEAEKRFVASALLAVIETEARSRGLESLRVHALVNTDRMYTACGFEVIGAAELPLAASVSLPCITMEKKLDYADPRPKRRRYGNGTLPVEVDRSGSPER